MTDLISRDELIHHLNECLAESDGKTPITDAVIVAIKCAVEQMPTVDAVQVVMCKDCENRNTAKCPIYPQEYEDDYCSFGERKNNA